MIFSGHTEVSGCTQCDYETARTSPTSFVFFIGLAIAGTLVVYTDLLTSDAWRWWYWAVLPIAEFVALFLLLAFVLWLDMTIDPVPAKCPRCSGEMEFRGGAFHDFASIPSPKELLILLLFVVVHVVVAVWLIN